MEISRANDPVGARAWHSIESAALEHDVVGIPAGPVEDLLALLGGGTHAQRVELWLGQVGARPVAAAKLSMPLHENTDSGDVELFVHPDHRRRGHGRALLAHVRQRAHGQGRQRIFGYAAAPLDRNGPVSCWPGQIFAAKAGARPVQDEVRRSLDLTAVNPALLAPVDTPGRTCGYSLRAWIDRAPPGLDAGLAALTALMSIDPPQGDTGRSPERWDAGRYRAAEDTALAGGRRHVVTAVCHDASASLVGYTHIAVNGSPVADQEDTIVRVEHRGHGLGLLLKAANLILLREHFPAVERVNTWNAASNTHMIAINDTLGFVPVDRWEEWLLSPTEGGTASATG